MKLKKIFFTLLIILLFVYLAIGLISGSFQNKKIVARYIKAQQEYERELELNKELKARLEQVRTPAFIELTAREKLGLVKPGEIAYRVIEEE